MKSFDLMIAASPFFGLLGALRFKPEAQHEENVSELSYEEAEAGFENAVTRLKELLERGSDAGSRKANSYLDDAVSYACRMNEINGGPRGADFKQALRAELLHNCVRTAIRRRN